MNLFEKYPELYIFVVPAILVPIMLGFTLMVMK
jgi:hypothetical protein